MARTTFTDTDVGTEPGPFSAVAEASHAEGEFKGLKSGKQPFSGFMIVCAFIGAALAIVQLTDRFVPKFYLNWANVFKVPEVVGPPETSVGSEGWKPTTTINHGADVNGSLPTVHQSEHSNPFHAVD